MALQNYLWQATGPAPAAGGAARCGVLLQKRGVPTGYLEAQSLKRTRGVSDPHRLLVAFKILFFSPFQVVSVTTKPTRQSVKRVARYQRQAICPQGTVLWLHYVVDAKNFGLGKHVEAGYIE